jgi:predicted house-cleaning noncanonical NTP pyrophosphatase (MazG superfamily)
MSCLQQGDFGGASSYLRRAIDLRDDDVNTMLGIAAIYLKRGDTGNALKVWLDVIEIDPENTYARRGLNYLKKNNDPDDFTDISSIDRINKFLPQPPKSRKKFTAAAFLIPIFLFIAIILIVPSFREVVFEYTGNISFLHFLNKTRRPEIPEIILDSRKDFINLRSENTFTFTEKEVEKKLEGVLDYLHDYRDNLAMRDLNMILLSNASEYVKERARLLQDYVNPPELTKFKDNFDYSEVKEFPQLYDGCFILWKGKPANLEVTTERIAFDFLVGYHENNTLEGIVPVSFNFTIRIIPDQPIELLAGVMVDDTGNLSLQGLAVHRLQ